MRRTSILIATISIAISGLVTTPANAGTYDGTNGTVDCSGGGSFLIVSNVVTGNTGCLGEIVIPNNVTSINAGSFQDDIVTKVTFASPSSVTTIGVNAFAGAQLATLEIPSSVVSIEDDAFGWNSDTLKTITFQSPSSVTALPINAFMGNNLLSSVSLPESLTSIGPNTFFGDIGLTTLVIPKNVTQIDKDAFGGSLADGASNLASLFFAGDAPTGPVGGSYLGLPTNTVAYVSWNAAGFDLDISGKWNGLTVVRGQNPAIAADLAARTIVSKKKYVAKALGKKVGLRIVSSKATVSIKVSSSSKKVCTKSGSKLKTLKPGKCVVTFTVQEPKPKSGKKPKATKTVKTLVVK